LQLAFEAGTLRCLLIDHLGEIKLKAANMPQLVQGQWHKVPKEALAWLFVQMRDGALPPAASPRPASPRLAPLPRHRRRRRR
jgi:hypothetical protein